MPSKDPEFIVVTGVNTGVGKTLLTALGLAYLLDQGLPVRAIKPFCSGLRDDARLLQRLHPTRLPLDLINPFYFTESIAPGVAVTNALDRPPVSQAQVLAHLHAQTPHANPILVEGAGGLLSPLGIDYTLLDLLPALPGILVIVGINRLGILNHMLLTLDVLQRHVPDHSKRICLMHPRQTDASTPSNASTLRSWHPGVEIVEFPYLGPRVDTVPRIRRHAGTLTPALGSLFSNPSQQASGSHSRLK